MRGTIRTLALGAVLATGAVTGAMAQGINNTGYANPYYGNNAYYGDRGTYFRNPGDTAGYNGYYGNWGYNGYGYPPGPTYVPGPVEGAANVVGGALNAAGNVAGAVVPPYGDRYDYYGYGSSYPPGWGPGYYRGYWGR